MRRTPSARDTVIWARTTPSADSVISRSSTTGPSSGMRTSVIIASSSSSSGRPRMSAGADLLQVADEGLVDLLPLAGDREDGLEPLAGLLDEPGPLAQAPRRGLRERGREDVVGPPGHLLRAPVERVEQGLWVDAVVVL